MTKTQYDIIITVCYSTNFVIQSTMIYFFNLKHSSELQKGDQIIFLGSDQRIQGINVLYVGDLAGDKITI